MKGCLYKLAEAMLAALKAGSKCEAGKRQTTCKLRFFTRFRLASPA